MAMMVVHVRVEGRVQGVGFREWTAREARGRGLAGFVRNRSDGSVEALFAGDPDGVAALVEACGRGPMTARVTRVDARPARSEDLPADQGGAFNVRPTL